MNITKLLLTNREACSSEVRRFVEVFGTSGRLTRANLIKAAQADLDLDWLTIQYIGKLAKLAIESDVWNRLDKAVRVAVPARGLKRRIEYANALADHWGLK